jgi:hypothetical protein
MIPFSTSGLPCYVETVQRVSRPATIEVTDAWLHGAPGRVTEVRAGQRLSVCFRDERRRGQFRTITYAMIIRTDGHVETNYTARLKRPIQTLYPQPML